MQQLAEACAFHTAGRQVGVAEPYTGHVCAVEARLAHPGSPLSTFVSNLDWK